MKSRRQTGNEYEDLAADYLINKNYTLIARNVRLGAREIDLIAEDGETIVFVETRARRSADFAAPAATVDKTKRRHLCEAAEAWLRREAITDRPCRFDVICIVHPPGRKPEVEHIEAAFMAGE